MERLISEKKDADRFLSILAPVFEGVFFVNLETDTVRQSSYLPISRKC